MTSRNYAVGKVSLKLTTVEIDGFTETSIQDYFSKHLGPENENARKTLRERPVIRRLCSQQPPALAAFVAVCQLKPTAAVSLKDLVFMMLRSMVTRAQERSHLSNLFGRQLPYEFDENFFDHSIVLNNLERLAFTKLIDGCTEACLNPYELNESEIKGTHLPKELLSFGLLKIDKCNEEGSYSFLDPVIQAYFAYNHYKKYCSTQENNDVICNDSISFNSCFKKPEHPKGSTTDVAGAEGEEPSSAENSAEESSDITEVSLGDKALMDDHYRSFYKLADFLRFVLTDDCEDLDKRRIEAVEILKSWWTEIERGWKKWLFAHKLSKK